MSFENALPIFFPFVFVLIQFETLLRFQMLAADGASVLLFFLPGVSLVRPVVVVVSVLVVAVAVVVAIAATAVAVSVAVSVAIVVALCTQPCCEVPVLFNQLADLILLLLYDF